MAGGPGTRRAVSGIGSVRVRHRPQHSRRRRHQSRWRMALLAKGGTLCQQIEEPVSTAEETVDVLVAGSAGALAGAYTAAREGLSVAIVEATDQFGGTFAYSGGGGMWYPCNPVLVRAGSDDTIDEALNYYRT